MLKPGQWDDLLKRLRKIDNPVVPDEAFEGRDPRQAQEARVRRTRRRITPQVRIPAPDDVVVALVCQSTRRDSTPTSGSVCEPETGLQ